MKDMTGKMARMAIKVAIPLLVLCASLTFFWKWTHGFTAFTVYSHTLAEAGPLPRPMPEISLIDQDSIIFRPADKSAYVMMNFVYLNCPFVCHKVNNQLEDIYHLMSPGLMGEKLEFVTVSFDLENDYLEKLKSYRKHFEPDIDAWTFALPHTLAGQEFQDYLREVGVWTYRIPGTMRIDHSAYLFLISPGNEIVQVFDPMRESSESIVKELEKWLSGENT